MSNNSSLENKISSLVSVSRRDSSIFTPFNSTHISISNYASLNDIELFFENTIDSFPLNLFFNIDEIIEVLNSAKDVNDILTIVEKFSIEISTSKVQLLTSNFVKNKDEIVKLIIKGLQNLKMKFLRLQISAKEILKTKGSWNLFLSRYFLKGVTPLKKSIIKAPIELIQVELIESKGELLIVKKEEKELNEKLFVFLQRESNVQKKKISEYASIDKNIISQKKLLKNWWKRKLK